MFHSTCMPASASGCWGRTAPASPRPSSAYRVPEYEIETKTRERRYVDGALLYELRMPFGYWEAKDEKDDLDTEIEFKFRRGYPQDNIIFEDSRSAVLIQNRSEVMRCEVDDVTSLEKLLGLFIGYERTEIAEFRKAVGQFKTGPYWSRCAPNALVGDATRRGCA